MSGCKPVSTGSTGLETAKRPQKDRKISLLRSWSGFSGFAKMYGPVLVSVLAKKAKKPDQTGPRCLRENKDVTNKER